MIVDLHTQIWQKPEQLGAQISAKLRRRFAETGEEIYAGTQLHQDAITCVDVAIILGWQSQHLGIDIPNEVIADYVKTAPDRLIGFAGVDPTKGGDPLKEVRELKMGGVVVSPCDQNFHPCDTRAMALFEACQDQGLPVVVHQSPFRVRDTVLEYAQPHLLDEVCRTFPKLRMVIARCGEPWVPQALTMIDKHEHVYADISGLINHPWQLINMLVDANQLEVTNKLLFGSGFPLMSPEHAIERIYSLNRFNQNSAVPVVPRERLRNMIERDTLNCLGIKRNMPAVEHSSDEAISLGQSGSPDS